VYTSTDFDKIIAKMKELSRKNVTPDELKALIGMFNDIKFKNSTLKVEVYIKNKIQAFVDSYRNYLIRLQNN
jgi:hypothetical protein